MAQTKKRHFKSSDVKKLTGLNDRQIQFIIDKGVIPLAEGGGKRGRIRKFTKQSLFEFTIAAEMARFGITVRILKSFIEGLRKPALGFVNRCKTSLINSKTGEREYPYIIFWIDPEDPEGYKAIFQPNGLKKVMQDIKQLKLISYLIIDFNTIHSEIAKL